MNSSGELIGSDQLNKNQLSRQTIKDKSHDQLASWARPIKQTNLAIEQVEIH